MIIVVDTETTGLDPLTAAIVELGLVALADDNDASIQNIFTTLVKPPHPIPPVASGIHHIVDDMVKKAPSLTKALLQSSKHFGPESITCYVAHNAQFDSGFLQGFGPWLCTWRVAQHIWPEAPSHSNSTLRYWLPGLELEISKTSFQKLWKSNRNKSIINPMSLPPHRALPDAWVTAHIVKRMLAIHPLSRLLELSSTPVLLRTCWLGEHHGKPWAEVPKSFCQWILSKGQRRPSPNGGRDIGFDDDTRYTALHYFTESKPPQADNVVNLPSGSSK